MKISNLIDLIENEYKFYVEMVEKNKESTDGNVYIVNGKDKKYVVKIYDNLAHATSMIQLHKQLKSYSINVPDIIENYNGEHITTRENEYVVCYSFIEGEKISNLDFNKARIKEIAKFLRRLHEVDYNNLALNTVPFLIESNRNSILHFDITKHNIFEMCGEIFFIDFDDAKIGPSVCDVAIAVTNLFISKATGADVDGINYFINEYYGDDEKLKRQELPLIKSASIAWINSIIGNPNFDTSTKDGLQNKINWISKIL